MKDVKVVIGGNYGDEGKGLMTSYFCRVARKLNDWRAKSIVVMTNGGAQRGHTVKTAYGLRHVFHHFGSGMFEYADTYFCDQFIINPIVFRQEYEELSNITYIHEDAKIYANNLCRWSTPFDMIANQIIEDSRGDSRHGSCGMGIWETIVRYESFEGFNLRTVSDMSDDDLKVYIRKIRDTYTRKRLADAGIFDIPESWKGIYYSEGLINNFVTDMRFMLSKVKIVTEDTFLRDYETVVFENGQGLLLDEKYGDHSTPSKTGLSIPASIIIENLNDYDVEVCYITRTYLTRHGAGPFPNECDAKDINPDIFDSTNVFNPWQGYIRYAELDAESFNLLTREDFERFAKIGWVRTVAVTHTNERDIPYGLKYDYWSDSETHVGRKERL